MKNTYTILKEKLTARYFEEDKPVKQNKSTNINVLLNRVKTDQQNEVRKKIYFSAAASTGIILFGLIIF